MIPVIRSALGNLDDVVGWPSYSDAMAATDAFVTVKVHLSQPVELIDFAQFFASLSEQFDEYIKEAHPDVSGEVKIYLREVRNGSIEADLVPLIDWVIQSMDKILIVSGFLSLLSKKVRSYIHGSFIEPFTKSNIATVANLVKAIAKDPDGNVILESVKYEQGAWVRRLELKFNTAEARSAVQALEDHKKIIDLTANSDRERVLMTFTRSDITDAQVWTRSGERVKIDDISNKSLALMYGSELAEQRIKHEIREADENVYKKGFVVDVNVQSKNGKPVAYAVKHVHQVIDLPDD